MNTTYPLGKKGVKTSGYGDRAGKKHRGVDIGIPEGTDVVSIADGKVVRSDEIDKKGYGNFICVEHPNLEGQKLFSCYAHLSKRLKNQGDTVKKGDVIGKSGGSKGAPGSGRSTGPHLHFEIRKDLSGNWVNPEPYLGELGVKPSGKESMIKKDLSDLSNILPTDLFSKIKDWFSSLKDFSLEEQTKITEDVDRIKDVMKKIL